MNTRNFKLKSFWKIIKATYKEWNEADPFRESAIVAYYAIFSLPALLVIVITVAGFAFGQQAAQGEISTQISGVMGKETAIQIEEMIQKAGAMKDSTIATIIGVITLLFGATGVFAQMQKSLNIIWEVKPKAKPAFLQLVMDRLFSFGLILSIGFLLLISLILTSILTVFSNWLQAHLPAFILYIFFILETVLSFGLTTMLFAFMFKILPDAKIKWRHVWVGSILTGLLFVAGKLLLGIYFGKVDPASAYGAAGSLVLVMLWVSYSSMIVFFGAEFTRQYTLEHEGEQEPMDIAKHVAGRTK